MSQQTQTQLTLEGFLLDQGTLAFDQAKQANANGDDEHWAEKTQDGIECFNAADSWRKDSHRIVPSPVVWATKVGVA